MSLSNSWCYNTYIFQLKAFFLFPEITFSPITFSFCFISFFKIVFWFLLITSMYGFSFLVFLIVAMNILCWMIYWCEFALQGHRTCVINCSWLLKTFSVCILTNNFNLERVSLGLLKFCNACFKLDFIMHM